MEGKGPVIRGIIFDMDGVLLSLPINYTNIRKRLQLLFDSTNALAPLLSSIESLTKDNPKLYAEALKILDEEELASADNMIVMKEVAEVLTFLKNEGYLLALVTLQGKLAADKALRESRLLTYFNTIITREDSFNRQKQIELAMKTLNLKKLEAVMCGDRINDVESAKKAGCYAIAVRQGIMPEITMADANVKSMLDIPLAINSLIKKIET